MKSGRALRCITDDTFPRLSYPREQRNIMLLGAISKVLVQVLK